MTTESERGRQLNTGHWRISVSNILKSVFFVQFLAVFMLNRVCWLSPAWLVYDLSIHIET